MSSDKKKFLKGVTSGYAYMIFHMIVSLWMVPFVLSYLTKPEYGVFAIATDLLGWLGIANLGITAAFNSKGAQLMGTKDAQELNIVASTTFIAQLISAVVIIIGGIYITLNPDTVFGNSKGIENIEIVVAIIVAGFFIQYITQPLSSMLVADKQIHIDNYLRFGLLAIQTTLTVILLTSGMKLLSLAISSFTSNIIITTITWYRVHKSLPDVKIKLHFWRTDRMLFLLKNGIWFTIGGIAGILIFRMDAFLIGKYISLSIVASFVINNRLYQIADKFHGQFFNITRPYFAQTYGRKEMEKLRQMYNAVFYSSFAFAFIIGIGVFLISRWFITWWVGPEFYLGDTINMLLCINFIVQAAVLPNRIILATTLYKNSLHSMTRIFEGLTKFIISILFLKLYGIEALILGGIVASLFFSNSALNYLSSNLLREKFLIKLVPLIFVLILPLILIVENPLPKYVLLLILVVLFFGYTFPKIIQNNTIIQPLYDKFIIKIHKKNTTET
jgi:O-antigen/teichoic acid export membrane protein